MVTPRGHGRFGQVVETLPAGFTYVSTDQPGAAGDGRRVVVHFLKDEPITYRVTAPAAAGVGSFSGVLRDEDKAEHQVGGQLQLTVFDLLTRYDADGDGQINTRLEYLAASRDYQDGNITESDLAKVLLRYTNFLNPL